MRRTGRSAFSRNPAVRHLFPRTGVSTSDIEAASPGQRYGRFMTAATVSALTLVATVSLSWSVITFGVHALAGAVPAVAVLWISKRRSEWVAAPSDRLWLGILLLLAGGIRVTALLILPYEPHADFQVYHEYGIQMSKTWELGGGAFRCFLPPGQVFALGVLYRLFGPKIIGAQLLNVAWTTGTVLGIWYLGNRLFGRRIGRTASLLAALLPSTVLSCLLIGAEAPEAFWLVLALGIYAAGRPARTGEGYPPTKKAAFLSGLCLGVGTLIRPTYLLLPAVLALDMLSIRPRRTAAAAAFLVAGALVAVAPWTVRNYRVTGGFIPVSSNAGGVLYSANNDQSKGDYTPEASEWLFGHATDDLSYNRLGRRKALEWIASHPRRFTGLALWRIALFWYSDKDIAWWAVEEWVDPGEGRHGLPPELRTLAMGASAGFYAAALCAAALGTWILRRRLALDSAWTWLPALLAYFTLVHMVFESQAKYHYMLVPLLMIPAAFAATQASEADRDA